jgi:hypothetical protein
MGKQRKNWISVIGITIVTLILVLFIAHFVVKSKLETVLSNKLPGTIKLTYSNLNLSLLKGKIELNEIKLTNFGKFVQKPNAEVNLEHLTISGFSYWNFIINNVIQIEDIYLKNPDVTIYHNETIPIEEYQVSHANSFEKHIEINKIKIEEGEVKMIDSKTDSLKLQTQNIHLKLEKIVYSNETKNRKIPINYGNYEVFFDSFFFQLSEYENMTINHTELTKDALELENFRFYTKYTIEKLSKIIPFERDHYNLEIDSILVEQPQLKVVKDSIWNFESKKVMFYQPDFNVYRDKLVTDDVRIKHLYSKMLRDLNMDLNLENLLIHNADISYSEKVKADRKAGTLTFSKFNADIKNVSNTYKTPTKTTINFSTEFMEHAPLKAVWTLDVNDKSDLFEFQADVGKLEASYLNRFMEPNLNVRLEGELDQTYFTISGNDNTSSIDFKVEYENFDVVALNKEGSEKNKLLTDVLNVFVSKNSASHKQPFKEAKKHGIERDKTKSVFNFIWISVRTGLLKTITIE